MKRAPKTTYLPGGNRNHATLRAGTAEYNRAWAALAAFAGDTAQVNGLESWQYMGTHGGRHEFRHRAHPVLGRMTWETPAVETP
jgi:hypothetical protein